MDIQYALDSLQADDQFSERNFKEGLFLKKVARYYTKEILSLLELGVWKA